MMPSTAAALFLCKSAAPGCARMARWTVPSSSACPRRPPCSGGRGTGLHGTHPPEAASLGCACIDSWMSVSIPSRPAASTLAADPIVLATTAVPAAGQHCRGEAGAWPFECPPAAPAAPSGCQQPHDCMHEIARMRRLLGYMCCLQRRCQGDPAWPSGAPPADSAALFII